MLGLAIGSAVANIAGGIFGKSEHDKYADLVESLQQEMPSEMDTAKDVYAGQSTKGLTGYDTTKDNIEGQTLTSLNEAKKYAESPAAILGLIGKMQSSQSGQMRALGVQDSQAHDANQLGYAKFLSQVYAPAKTNLDKYNASLVMGAQQERMAGTSELMGGITGGINSGASIYGQGQQLSSQKTMNEALMSFWEGGGTKNPIIGVDNYDTFSKPYN